MRSSSLLLTFAIAAALVASGRPSAQSPSVISQLDRYLRGEHDAVVAELASRKSVDDVLESLKRDAPGWIDAAGPDARARRRLAAATFALEMARETPHLEWKVLKRLDAWQDGAVAAKEGADRVYWRAPALLVEWGCALLREEPKPPPIERIWHLASVAAAMRAGDMEFLVGTPFEARMNAEDEITHLWHAQDRFKAESRLKLAMAIALEWRTWPQRRGAAAVSHQRVVLPRFEALMRDEAVGAEAAVRAGSIYVRSGRLKDALAAFEKVEAATRDRYLIYLARFFKAQALQRAGRLVDAEAAYRGALDVIPQTQSATIALAALMAAQDRRAEAESLIEAQLATAPAPVDPWRAYAVADDRFWPDLIARLRAEIHP